MPVPIPEGSGIMPPQTKYTLTQPRICMSKKRYYYDLQSCRYVEDKWGGLYNGRQVLWVAVLAFLIAFPLSWVIDTVDETPQEVALKTENAILEEGIEEFGDRMDMYVRQLEGLEESDRELHRVLLGVEPISEDVRRLGVGGSDPYEEFDRLGSPTGTLLKETAQRLDQIEGRINLQGASLRDLMTLANEQMDRNDQTPAILPASGRVVSGFGMRKDPFLGVRRMHYGIDISVREGSPVVASAAGRILKRGYNTSYGHHVIISHPASETETLYAHLSEIDDTIRRGREVERGERIGLSGNTGRSAGPHVHFEVRDARGRAQNPISFMSPSMTPAQYAKLKHDAERETKALDY